MTKACDDNNHFDDLDCEYNHPRLEDWSIPGGLEYETRQRFKEEERKSYEEFMGDAINDHRYECEAQARRQEEEGLRQLIREHNELCQRLAPQLRLIELLKKRIEESFVDYRQNVSLELGASGHFDEVGAESDLLREYYGYQSFEEIIENTKFPQQDYVDYQ